MARDGRETNVPFSGFGGATAGWRQGDRLAPRGARGGRYVGARAGDREESSGGGGARGGGRYRGGLASGRGRGARRGSAGASGEGTSASTTTAAETETVIPGEADGPRVALVRERPDATTGTISAWWYVGGAVVLGYVGWRLLR
jgi:hypothetical protein